MRASWEVVRFLIPPDDSEKQELVCAPHAQSAIRGMEDFIEESGIVPCSITIRRILGAPIPHECTVCERIEKFRSRIESGELKV